MCKFRTETTPALGLLRSAPGTSHLLQTNVGQITDRSSISAPRDDRSEILEVAAALSLP